MPYRCSVERGQVRFQRGPERIHRIIGSREQQTVTVCSGPRSDACNAVVVHRFALECSGQSVPWLYAAAAGSGSQPWRASVAGGRMTLHFVRTGPARDRASMIALPLGFAPAPTGGWRFLPFTGATAGRADDPRHATVPDVSDAAPVASAGDANTNTNTNAMSGAKRDMGRDLSGHTILRDAARGGEVPSSGTVTGAPLPMGAGWTASVAIAREEAWPWTAWALVPATGSSGFMAALALIALLLSATAVAARQRFGAQAPMVATAPVPSGDSPVAGTSPPPLPQPPVPQSSPQPATISPPPPTVPVRAAIETAPALAPVDPDTTAWLQVAEMRATAEALLDLDRQIVADHVPDGPLREVLIADLGQIATRLDGPDLAEAFETGRLDLVHPIYAQAIVDLERARTLARIEHERILETAAQSDRSLATPEEACAFLGVNPRASEAVVKKVVDALRQNWHPDHAGDAADRQAREMRMKHINAAWDLIRTR